MASIPKPRSKPQVVSDILNAFQARQGLETIKVGSAILSFIEAAAQSDVRVSQDLFGYLNAVDLSRAEGDALDNLAANEGLTRRSGTFSSGLVTISDTSFSKISSSLYRGQPAPIVGSSTIYIQDASSFPSTGSLYIGRGTTNYEGPLTYTAKTNLGSYWSVTLAGGQETQRFHPQGQEVVYSQGGDRFISAGTVCQTPQGNVAASVSFSLSYGVTLQSGEVTIPNVQVVCQTAGISGNVGAGAINTMVSSFTGAAVTNPLPFGNALGAEDDDALRERIRQVRQTRSKGTALALETAALGVSAPGESASVTSASTVVRQGTPTTLYIDDGTGYEEKTQGIAREFIIPDAVGGERFFVTDTKPVAKAFVENTLNEPYALTAGDTISVAVSGISYPHTFASEQFLNISSANAYEVVASINSDGTLPFRARLSSSGLRVSILAIEDTDESVQVTSAPAALGFPSGKAESVRLYKNDRLLEKDGRSATLTSFSQGLWASALTNPATLRINVDDTGERDFTFQNLDFVNAGTGYSILSASNSLSSWVKVFNAKMTGVVATVSGSSIVLSSARGHDNQASLSIVSGTLVNENVFNVGSSSGQASDYTLDRNSGSGKLNTALVAGDRLSIGTASTRGFIESSAISLVNIVSPGADLWWVVDDSASVVSTSVTSGASVTVADSGVLTPWGDRVRISSASALFVNVAVGDWAVFHDTGLSSGNRGAFRVVGVDPTSLYIDVERPSSVWVAETKTLVTGGIAFARTSSHLIKTSIPVGTLYTASALVDLLNASLVGAKAELNGTTKIRVRTDNFSGSIALVAQNTEGAKLSFLTGFYASTTSHLAATQSSGIGTPEFTTGAVSTVTNPTTFVRTGVDPSLTLGHSLHFLAPLADLDASYYLREGNIGETTQVSAISGTTITTSSAAFQDRLVGDRFFASSAKAIGPEDTLAVLMNGDNQTGRFSIPMYRKISPVSSTYGVSQAYVDADLGGASLATGFGSTYDFVNFAVWMKARAKSHAEGGVDTTKTILWRYYRHGPEGELAKLKYVYPTAASQAVSIATVSNVDGFTEANVTLPSGPARTGVTTQTLTKVGVAVASGPNNAQTITYLLGLNVFSGTRVFSLDYDTQTVNWTVGETVTGFGSGATGVVSVDVDNGTTGTLTLTGVIGVFSAGEVINGSVSGVAKVVQAYGTTTLILDVTTPGLTDHGFQIGDTLYLNSSNVNFTSQTFSITARTTTGVTFKEASLSAHALTLSIGTVSASTAESKLSGSTVVTGDISNITSLSALPSSYQVSGRVSALGTQYWKSVTDTSISTGTVATWYLLNDALSFFPINSTAAIASAIATSVNALTNSPVTAVAVGAAGVATGVITLASFDEFSATANKAYQLEDGLNWIGSYSVSGNYTFTFKKATSTLLLNNCDWLSEDVRIVPLTSKNLADWFNTQTVSGLPSSAIADVLGNGVQISSLTLGSLGSVQVQGGSANSTSCTVVGSASSVASTYGLATVSTSNIAGLRAGQWVSLINSKAATKNNFGTTAIMGGISGTGHVTMDAASSVVWALVEAADVAPYIWQIEKQGNFVAYKALATSPSMASLKEGDWVELTSTALPGGLGQVTAVNSLNTGTFRIVRADSVQKTFWIENPLAVEQTVGSLLTAFYTYDSVMPGDSFVINTTDFGTNNVGTWTVSSRGATDKEFYITRTSGAPTAWVGPLSLSAISGAIQLFPAAPTHLIKKIRSIAPGISSAFADVKFETDAGYAQISSAVGTLIQPLDKLAFSVDSVAGLDGYRVSTGLLAEVNRVIFGDRSDSSTYPGVAAAGQKVNIEGAPKRKVTCSLGLRLRTGTISADVEAQVRSSVASAINSLGVGESVAISDIVTAAQNVYGVQAVTVLSPTYSVGNDLISLQPYEKAWVFNSEQDISLTIVGV